MLPMTSRLAAEAEAAGLLTAELAPYARHVDTARINISIRAVA